MPNCTVAGTVTVDGQGSAPGAIIHLRRDDWDATSDSCSIDVVADSAGNFSARLPCHAPYVLEARHERFAALLELDSSRLTARLETRVDLEPVARLEGRMLAGADPRLTAEDLARASVVVRGTDSRVQVDSMGRFAFEDLPAGSLTLGLKLFGSETVIPLDVVALAPGDDVVLEPFVLDSRRAEALENWLRSARVHLRTAGIPYFDSSVADFPLLLRLDSSNFDFSAAAPGGGDLRFFAPDGRSLPHAVREWDAGARRALVWVLLDSIRANDSAQWFSMRWGNPGAAGLSSPLAVFDSARGFLEQWSMADAGDAPALVDPSLSLTAFGGTRAAMDGAVGGGRMLSPSDAMRTTLPRRILDSGFTLSVWIRPAGDQLLGANLLALQEGEHPFRTYSVRALGRGERVDANPFLALAHGAAVDTADSAYFLEGAVVSIYAGHTVDGQWSRITIQWEPRSGEARLFQDGRPFYVRSFVDPLGLQGPDVELVLGALARGGQPGYSAVIDEVRLDRGCRSASWLALEYANEAPDRAWVSIGP